MKRFSPLLVAITTLSAGQIAMAQTPVPKSELKQPVTGAVSRSTLVGHADATQVLHVTVALPYRDLAGIQKFVDGVSNPKSPNYRHFISPDEVGSRFGQTADAVSSVEDYFRSQGFKIKLVSKNHLAIVADCTVSQAESAFSTTINNYSRNNKMEPGRPKFYSHDSKLTVPSSIAPYIQYVSGLENSELPQPLTTLTPAMSRTLYGISTMFAGGDTGLGRKIGILNLDGYRLSNVPLFYTNFGLPTPSGGVGTNIHPISINGSNGNTATAVGEGDLDIQMVLGQAPLADLYIYDDAGDGDLLGTITREINDNIVDVCSASYGFGGQPTTFFDPIHAEYLSGNASGITNMYASGDSGTTVEPHAYATYEPEVLLVGGTIATTDGAGNRTSEVVWNDGSGKGGGGWALEANSFNVLPSWQVGTGVPTTNNHRLSPDVSGHAGGPGGAYTDYYSGTLQAWDGTSASSPIFAAQLAIAEQELIAEGSLPADGMGHQRFGRINDLIYSQNGRSDIWFDVTSGTNGTLPDSTVSNAGVGWDYASGWGAINWQGFVNAVALPQLSFSVNTVKGGASVTGTVTIASPAGAGGVNVPLSSDSGAAVVPSSVTILNTATQATFNITTANTNYNNITAHISATFPGSIVRTRPLVVTPGNSAVYVSQVVPSTMTAGQSYVVTVQYKNVGSTTWDLAHAYKLQARNPSNNTNFGPGRLPLTNYPVAPGQTGIFSATAIAPATTGTYNFQWIPIQDSTGVAFGALSPNVAVSVTKVGDAARYVSRTGVTNVYAGADFFVSYTMMNVGINSWKDSTGYTMMTINPNNNTVFGQNIIHMPGSVTVVNGGGSVTFTKQLTAPITPGTYTMQWQMDKSGTPFGDTTPLLTMIVSHGPDDAGWVSTVGAPTSIGPGKTFSATVTMENLGTATWDGTYKLVPVGTNNFGVTGIVATSTAPLSNMAFTATFTAPVTPGTYTFQWRTQHSGVNFGQNSQGISVVVSADAAAFVSRAGATTVFAGADFFPQYTMKNMGTTTWTQAAGYSEISQDPLNNTVWGVNRLLVPSSATVTPGSTVVCTNLCTAPIVPGTYPMQWQMAKGGVPFGALTPIQTMTVVSGPDNAQFISESGVPTTIVHGATFNATINMKNLGSATWDGTYSLVPVGSNTFGVAGITATSTAQGATHAFTTTFTAPATPGTYTFRMRMQHVSTKFGQGSTQVTITVT